MCYLVTQNVTDTHTHIRKMLFKFIIDMIQDRTNTHRTHISGPSAGHFVAGCSSYIDLMIFMHFQIEVGTQGGFPQTPLSDNKFILTTPLT